jgi:hypothetical protein
MYFTYKNEPDKAQRRQSLNGVRTEIGGSVFTTYYYSPSQVIKFFGKDFQLMKVKPVGFFIPPSYLNPFVTKHPVLFKCLNGLERLINSMGFLGDYADHYLIHFTRK